ncbi:MAG TPA: carboxyl transferase domain-containing protein [Dehalococcoidia bacterium]|nr:carboxyl transferase domain-containing protein [Dehalococcoidia bacterium]
MSFTSLLVANRGEIAIRIIRAASDLGIHTVAVYSEDDASALHTRVADDARPLNGIGAPAYLDIEGVIAAAKDAGCDALHPGYGFLAENAAFARRCAEEGITFVGPSIEMLELFGNKALARAAASDADVPVIRGTDRAVTLHEAREFFASLGSGGAMMIKAIAGGGGRGTRAVTSADEIEATYERCRSEALSAFGNGDVYVEELIARARHIEVQILGDEGGAIAHLGERECSIQRRYQKVVEVAPAPNLPGALRERIIEASMRFAKSVGYNNLGTFEFLVDASEGDADATFAFIETNARLQVEHTVTEQVTGVDIVQAQIRLASGASLAELGLDDPRIAEPRGYAIQARVNMETVAEDGSVRPTGGTLTAYEAPGGPGVRTDGFGYAGYETSSMFDSLLAKVIGHSPSSNFADAIARTSHALSEFRIEGFATNIPFLLNVLAHDDFAVGNVHTRFVEEQITALTGGGADEHRRRFADPDVAAVANGSDESGFAGAQVDSDDPLALFAHDASVKSTSAATPTTGATPDLVGPNGSIGVPAPIQGTLVALHVSEGDEVREGQQIAVVEAMKMEHVITADRTGIIRGVSMSVGDVVRAGFPLVFIEAADVKGGAVETAEEVDPDFIRGDLAEVNERRAHIFDENRPDAVERRRRFGQRTARENIADLMDEGTFKEFGPLVLAAQRSRRTVEWLRERTPADGLVAGVGSVNGVLVDDEHARAIAVHYDYTVFAGTQGQRNHYKQDRMYELAHRYQLPVILFAEGGGGRPGDTGREGGVGFDNYTFTQFAKLSGRVPMVGVTSGRCFAGNTALLACCDVIIATENSTIAMGGPAMIEGGGLGIYTPEEVGPMSFQVPNGVVDILVEDEEEAVRVAKQYVSYFQGPIEDWETPDQRKMRHIVPENRVQMYDMRDVIETLADKDSVLEIRREFGIGIITAFVRIEGKPMGLIANNPHHLAGAIDSDGADKGARFLQLCDAFDLPVISLMDCPGMMVGPDVESTALVRHCARMFNTGANLSVPMFGVVVRKAYGLGVQAMCGASSLVPFFTVAWPTAEFAGMNIEGSVKLGYRDDLAAIEDPQERLEKYESMVAAGYERAKAANAAVYFGIDDVIDPADSRDWIVTGLRSLPPTPRRTEKKRPYIDTW